jgi:hypothetical protein
MTWSVSRVEGSQSVVSWSPGGWRAGLDVEPPQLNVVLSNLNNLSRVHRVQTTPTLIYFHLTR